jgi:hypothetical protein
VRDKSKAAATARTAGDTAVVGVARTGGGPPPDVIEVVFPAAGGPRNPPRATGAGPAPPATRPGPEAERWWERQLLLGGLALVAVALATALAWQVWPQSTAPSHMDGPPPGPVPGFAASLPTDGGPGSAGLSGGRSRPGPATASPGTSVLAPTTHAVTPAAPAAGPAATPSTQPPAQPSTTPAAPRTLRAGDRGVDVTELQNLLFGQGLTYVSATGVYDDATVRGVEQVQSDRSLSCDPRGVYGACTRAALTGG